MCVCISVCIFAENHSGLLVDFCCPLAECMCVLSSRRCSYYSVVTETVHVVMSTLCFVLKLTMDE